MRHPSVLLSFSAVAALTANPAGADSVPLETVDVTATRVVREGYEAPSPTTVLGADFLTSRAPDTLANVISRLPQMRNASDEGTGSLQFGQSAGRGFVNLRGLGTNRTLVLLDGERPVGNALSGERDILSLPAALITGVDIVTGGASASYGSDAIAGVVNFRIDNRFTGFTATLENGASSRGDAEVSKLAAAWGGELGERTHLVASAEYFERDGLSARSRSFATPPAIVSNSGADLLRGERPLRVVRNAYDADQAPGGLILDGPLAGQQFGADGTTSPYVPSSCTVGQPYVLCNSPQNSLASTLGTIALTAAQRRIAGFGRLTLEIAPEIEARVDALLSRNQTSITSIPLETSEFGIRLPIYVEENPFLSETVRAQYVGAGASTFLLGRQNTDQGVFADEFDQRVASFSGSLHARLAGSWFLKARASYGESDTGERWINAYSLDRFLNAADAVSVNGVPTCRINAAAITDPLCRPANVFGSGNMSAEAKAYFLGTIHKPLKTYQRELALDVTGTPLAVSAGPLSVAAGVVYREERSRQLNDAAPGQFAFAGYPAFAGEIRVSEAYSEAVIPLLHDMPFANSIEADLAARWVHYSQAGSEWPWKVGLNWTPVRGARVRLTTSRDIRAPNVLELYLPQFLSSISSQVNPLPNGVPLFNSLGVAPGETLNVREIGGGNPALTPEIARTSVAGLVLEPTDVPGLALSIDYYETKIRDAVTTVPSSTIVGGCAAGEDQFCELIQSSPGSSLPLVSAISVNAQSFTTGGLDAEASYSFGIGGGQATVRALANYILEYEQRTRGSTKQDLRGEITAGLPALQGDVSLQFSKGGTAVLLSGVYIGSGSYRKNMAAQLQNNHVSHVWYVGASVDRRLPFVCDKCSVFAAVNNLFDAAPPHPGLGIYTSLDATFDGVPYDRIGRYFKIGLRLAL